MTDTFDPTDENFDEDDNIPTYIDAINTWLDQETDEGTDVAVIESQEFTASGLADFLDVRTPMASTMLQQYRVANYWMDQRCLYVIAHEGSYGAGAPWRVLGTRHAVPETTRRQYRLNQIRHLTWEFFDHAKKEVKSFGAENRQALAQVDEGTTSRSAERQRFALRDYARDLLLNLRNNAQTRAQVLIDGLGVPRTMQNEYYKYFFDGFWPYVEVMVDEEVQVLESLITP